MANRLEEMSKNTLPTSGNRLEQMVPLEGAGIVERIRKGYAPERLAEAWLRRLAATGMAVATPEIPARERLMAGLGMVSTATQGIPQVVSGEAETAARERGLYPFMTGVTERLTGRESPEMLRTLYDVARFARPDVVPEIENPWVKEIVQGLTEPTQLAMLIAGGRQAAKGGVSAFRGARLRAALREAAETKMVRQRAAVDEAVRTALRGVAGRGTEPGFVPAPEVLPPTATEGRITTLPPPTEALSTEVIPRPIPQPTPLPAPAGMVGVPVDTTPFAVELIEGLKSPEGTPVGVTARSDAAGKRVIFELRELDEEGKPQGVRLGVKAAGKWVMMRGPDEPPVPLPSHWAGPADKAMAALAPEAKALGAERRTTPGALREQLAVKSPEQMAQERAQVEAADEVIRQETERALRTGERVIAARGPEGGEFRLEPGAKADIASEVKPTGALAPPIVESGATLIEPSVGARHEISWKIRTADGRVIIVSANQVRPPQIEVVAQPMGVTGLPVGTTVRRAEYGGKFIVEAPRTEGTGKPHVLAVIEDTGQTEAQVLTQAASRVIAEANRPYYQTRPFRLGEERGAVELPPGKAGRISEKTGIPEERVGKYLRQAREAQEKTMGGLSEGHVQRLKRYVEWLEKRAGLRPGEQGGILLPPDKAERIARKSGIPEFRVRRYLASAEAAQKGQVGSKAAIEVVKNGLKKMTAGAAVNPKQFEVDLQRAFGEVERTRLFPLSIEAQMASPYRIFPKLGMKAWLTEIAERNFVRHYTERIHDSMKKIEGPIDRARRDAIFSAIEEIWDAGQPLEAATVKAIGPGAEQFVYEARNIGNDLFATLQKVNPNVKYRGGHILHYWSRKGGILDAIFGRKIDPKAPLEEGLLVPPEAPVTPEVRVPSELRRMGKPGYERDPFAALDLEVRRVARKAYWQPVFQDMRATINKSPRAVGTVLENWMRDLKGREHEFDALVREMTQKVYDYAKVGRVAPYKPVTRLAVPLIRLRYSAVMDLNPGPVVKNFFQRINHYAEFGDEPKAVMAGIRASLTKVGIDRATKAGVVDDFEAAEYLRTIGVLSRPEQVRRGVSEVGIRAFRWMETKNRVEAFNVGYEWGKTKGLSDQAATTRGLKSVADTQFLYGKIGMPQAFRHPLGKTTFQLMSWPVKQTEWVFRHVMEARRYAKAGDATGMHREVGILLRWGALNAAAIGGARALGIDPSDFMGFGQIDFRRFWPPLWISTALNVTGAMRNDAVAIDNLKKEFKWGGSWVPVGVGVSKAVRLATGPEPARERVLRYLSLRTRATAERQQAYAEIRRKEGELLVARRNKNRHEARRLQREITTLRRRARRL
jgi:hypothetical protein